MRKVSGGRTQNHLSRNFYGRHLQKRHAGFEALERRHLLAGIPVISEVLASNDRTLFDNHGNDSDYIEILNTGDTDLSLNRYFLTDDPHDMRKWRFPDITLESGNYLTVFASGNDQNDRERELHTNFRLSSAGEYLALVKPDGETVAFAYEPSLPQQHTDISYGIPTGIERSILVGRESPARFLVPTDGHLEPTEPDVVARTWLDPAFDDSNWTPVTAALGYTPENEKEIEEILADSVVDFSGNQSDGNWTYGIWPKSHDPDGIYDAADFFPMPANGFNTSDNVWEFTSARITASGGEPTAGFFTNWSIRRWTSETQGKVVINGTLGNSDPEGDGVIGRIFVNGTELFSHTVNGTSIDYGVTTHIAVGDVIDFVLGAGAEDDDTADASTFTAVVHGPKRRLLPRVDAAHSVNDWVSRSAVQGINNWHYGYYEATADADRTYQHTDFVAFGEHHYALTRWDWDISSELRLSRTMQTAHANTDTVHWPIRRWESNVDGQLEVEYEFGNSSIGGDGVTARLFHNGVEVDMTQAMGDDRSRETRLVTISNVRIGDYIDLAVDPLGPGGDPQNPDGEFDRALVKVSIARFADLSEHITSDVSDLMEGIGSTAYVRIPFVVDDLGILDEIILNVKYDDGFLGFVNGRSVAQRNVPDGITFDSVASSDRSDIDATKFESFDITDQRGLFVEGDNFLQFQLVNRGVDDPNALLQAEIVIGTLASRPDEFRYFAVPSPGAANGLGANVLGPQIVESTHTPHLPESGEPIMVTATVAETFNALADIVLQYKVMYGDPESIPMLDDGLGADAVVGDGVYTAVIPADTAQPGELVRWFVTAHDTLGLSGRFPVFQRPTRDEEFAGTIISDPTVHSNLPVFDVFIEQITRGQTTGSLYYDGELYTNVHFSRHGQSSVGFQTNKKSLNIDFPNDHRFRLRDDLLRVDDVNFLTNFADMSKLRNTLAYEQLAMTGGAHHLAFPIHVRNNGEFFGIYDFVEDAGSEWLDRLGFDPEGALYKSYDTFNSVSMAEKKNRTDEDKSDLQALIDGTKLRDGGDLDFIMDNVNIARMVNFVAGFDIIHDNDCCHKNYYVYQDTSGTGEWWFLPWDVDLSNGRKWGGFGRAYFDETIYFTNPFKIGSNNALISDVFRLDEFDEMYFRRLRTLMDQYIKPPGTPEDELPLENRINEMLELFPAEAALDNELHPTPPPPKNTTIGFQNGQQTFEEAIQNMLEGYVKPRRDFLYSQAQSDASHLPQLISGDTGEVTASYFVPTDDSLRRQWTAREFDDGAWKTGSLGMGFAPRNNFEPLIATDLKEEMQGISSSLYVRVPFTVDDSTSLNSLSLGMKFDDGFAAYINGVEVTRDRLRYDPEVLTFETRGRGRSNEDSARFTFYDISSSIDLLTPGENVLAIHVVNSSAVGNDLLVQPTLVEGRVADGNGPIPPAQVGNPHIDFGTIEFNPASGNQREEYLVLTNNNSTSVDMSDWTLKGDIAHTFDPGTVLVAGGSLYVTPDARAFRARAEGPSGGQRLWGQGNYGGFLPNAGGTIRLMGRDGEEVNSVSYTGQVNSLQEHLRISELMYNPQNATDAELAVDNSLMSEDFEYTELVNISANTTLDLTGVRFTSGLQFDFTNSAIMALAPGERLLLVSNAEAFALRYGEDASARVAGTFQANSALRDTGERVILQSSDGSVVLDFSYDDTDHQGWPPRADGDGSSLQIVDPRGDYQDPANWEASREIGGSPGERGNRTMLGIVINEILSRPIDPQTDSMELFNPTDATVDLSNYYLSDSADSIESLQKYSLSGNISSGDYLVLTESDFNSGGGQNPSDFGLSRRGDQLFLTLGDGTKPTHFVDSVYFDGAQPGETFGRADTAVGGVYPLVSQTLGADNSDYRVGPVIISEFFSSPGDPSLAALDIHRDLKSSDLEFVEIHNPTVTPIELSNWTLELGIDFEFGSGTTLGSGETAVVISFDPANPKNASRLASFRKHYELDEAVGLLGGYANNLTAGGERIRLVHTTPPGVPNAAAWLEDEVVYDDTSPWVTTIGRSLNRVAVDAYGNHSSGWLAGPATPGAVKFELRPSLRGDLTNDNAIDAYDIDTLFQEVATGKHRLEFDLTQDGRVDSADVNELVRNILQTDFGDANLDHRVDQEDFTLLAAHFGTSVDATWSVGDFDGDNAVSFRDFVLLTNRIS